MNRMNLRYALLAVFFAATTWYCGMGVVMNGAFSVGADGAQKHHYVGATITFEILTVLCFVATIVCVILTKRAGHSLDRG